MAGSIWTGNSVAVDVTKLKMYQDFLAKQGIVLCEDEKMFECRCADCGAVQLFKISEYGVPILIRSEHAC